MITAASIIKNLPSAIRAACRKTTASLESSPPPERRVAFQRSVVRTLLLSLFALTFLFLLASVSFATTWYIKADGTGDAPTIQAGVDSAAAGDTVLVGPGEYVLEWDPDIITMKDGIVLTSENGPSTTRITRKWYIKNAIECTGLGSPNTEISGFWIEGFDVYDFSTAIYITGCEFMKIRNIVSSNNSVGINFAVPSTYNYIYLENNTIYGCNYSLSGGGGFANNNIFWGVAEGFGYLGFSTCNNFLNIADADVWAAYNFSQDPEFCGASAGNFFLQSDSPCAPGNPPMSECGLIGALPVGCSTVPFEQRTWGAIKSIYKD